MSFKKLLETEKLKLDGIKESKQRNEIFRTIHENYLKEINKLIEQLNKSQDDQRGKILKQIKETDRLYLQAKGIEITAHILFSRHGKCSTWGQKKLGLSPNAAISERAAKNMEITNQLSGRLLFYPANQHPRIAISPMNRAMQTAGLVIPVEINNAQISILPFLVENSISPSGYDVRSKKDMQKLYDRLSFWKAPIQKILLKISMWIFNDEDFKQLYKKRMVAAENIQTHGMPVILESGADGKPDVCQNLDYSGDKIKDTKALIEGLEQQDCWLFGHGKNFKTFFQHVLGIESDFDYGETRSVYKIKCDGEVSSLYHPPYVMLINQETGKIEGKYTATLSMASMEKTTHERHDSEISDVPQVMAQLGKSISKNIQPMGLENNRKLTSEEPVVFFEEPALETDEPGKVLNR
ncbi:coiled-coil protein [Legionella sainthelensi]|uniref:histidine phosphatase family protein n=1 Tax=Legionella sainthelensi TaxID=28087 RepID=UPI000F6F1A17|nr:histidine phosphatase family protein [Legionella sainthelensi]VEB34059.1 coiled-coil protein [Legionella sainthelensi]